MQEDVENRTINFAISTTKLKSHLDGKPPAPSKDKQPFLANAALGEPLAVI